MRERHDVAALRVGRPVERPWLLRRCCGSRGRRIFLSLVYFDLDGPPDMIMYEEVR